MRQLDNEQRRLAEENMGLVGGVIRDHVWDIRGVGIFTRDDLFQIGCVGLCKAASAYKPGKAKFSTYAYILIRNEIFDALEYATLRRNREQAAGPGALPGSETWDMPGGDLEALNLALDAALAGASGVTAKGIKAIRLLAEGYTHREIGERLDGISANNVSAWVARARKLLRADPAVVSLRESI
ncbi:MAG: sigma-70 family RNA polymerase sigma factor [Gracilibacteraceae bacterium]|jgi:RNA polymerase sigma factor (sigma-70 family)|nr:sigma-70 family RNA polymerase sigma factor [Gracilibacteraceae bacterium]